MKLTLAVCAMAVLCGCQSETTSPGVTRSNETKQGGPGDSPIVVSDGQSTHLKHKGSNADFQIVYSNGMPEVTVQDSGFTAKTLDCFSGVTCAGNPIALVKGWTLDVYDAAGATGTKIMTVSSSDNATIVTNFYAHAIDPESDAGDTNGTKLIQHDYTFKSASFTNGGGAPAVTLNCASSPCKLKIHYKN